LTQNEEELKRIGKNFLGILNDLKRRPEDAANELSMTVDDIQKIIQGEKDLSPEIIEKAIKAWPINPRDFYLIHDDCPNGVRIMSFEESEKTSRIMDRGGYPYYEYRDTAMSSVAPFRPEWISELCIVGDNNPENPDLQWNNGHFMHQFTYFIGDVNFYFIDSNGQKSVAVMNTGDSMYITPFVPHTFTTRKGAKKNGLILALTYGNNLAGDVKHELSALGSELATQYVIDFSNKEKAISSLLNQHLQNSTVSIEELSRRTGIDRERLDKFLSANTMASYSELEKIASALNINVRDILPNDKIEKKVVVQKRDSARRWTYPETSKSYELVELASTLTLPFSKAIEFKTLLEDGNELDLQVGLHQFGYNVGDSDIIVNWHFNDQNFTKTLRPGDSFYMKPFVKHSFRKNGKILVLRISGKIAGDPQRELSHIGKRNAHRAINESIQWFNPKGKN